MPASSGSENLMARGGVMGDPGASTSEAGAPVLVAYAALALVAEGAVLVAHRDVT
jgi:hypothetical protein